MRLSNDQCRAIAVAYESTNRSIATLARDHKTTQASIRAALSRAGVKITRNKPQGYRCQLCGRQYTHSFCAVCSHHGCAPVMKLRKRNPYVDEPSAREYVLEKTSRGIVFRVMD